jgi:hypothetical protein
MAMSLWLPSPNDPATDIYGTPDHEARFIREILRRGRSLPEYFHLLGIPLFRGRLFTEFDVAKAPKVAIINDAFARTWWPGDPPTASSSP